MKTSFINTLLLTLIVTLFSCEENKSGEGEDHFNEGRYEEAIKSYSKTIDLNPHNKQALYNRGRAYDELGDHEAAINDLKAALKYDDKNSRYLLSLGDVYYKQKKFDNALYYYELAVDVERNNSVAHYKRARAFQALGKVRKAMDSYEAALRENKDLGEAYLSRAALKISQQDATGACEDLRQAERLSVNGATEALAKYCK